jgi:hypothetical protein
MLHIVVAVVVVVVAAAAAAVVVVVVIVVVVVCCCSGDDLVVLACFITVDALSRVSRLDRLCVRLCVCVCVCVCVFDGRGPRLEHVRLHVRTFCTTDQINN